VGAVLVILGAAALLHAFGRFVLEGLGTPAPVAPPERLVVGGLYCYVRNPMYVAVLATIIGQALLLLQPVLLIYAAVVAALMATFVYGYKEPTLGERFDAEYEAYRRLMTCGPAHCRAAGRRTDHPSTNRRGMGRPPLLFVRDPDGHVINV